MPQHTAISQGGQVKQLSLVGVLTVRKTLHTGLYTRQGISSGGSDSPAQPAAMAGWLKSVATSSASTVVADQVMGDSTHCHAGWFSYGDAEEVDKEERLSSSSTGRLLWEPDHAGYKLEPACTHARIRGKRRRAVGVNEALGNMGSGLMRRAVSALHPWSLMGGCWFVAAGAAWKEDTDDPMKAMWQQCCLLCTVFILVLSLGEREMEAALQGLLIQPLQGPHRNSIQYSFCTETGAPRRSSQADWGTLSHVTRPHCAQAIMPPVAVAILRIRSFIWPMLQSKKSVWEEPRGVWLRQSKGNTQHTYVVRCSSLLYTQLEYCLKISKHHTAAETSAFCQLCIQITEVTGGARWGRKTPCTLR